VAGAAEHVDAASSVPTCDLLVVGCGNLLRGDDGVGPILVRHLWDGGVPGSVRLVDGGTAGMDVAFQMRGAARVVIVDACRTGAAAGTVFRVPGPAVEDLPPLTELHTHSFRWDNALAFARWLLGEDYPDDVTVFLIEATSFEPGAELGPEVEKAMHEVLGLIRDEPAFAAAPSTPEDRPAEDSIDVEFADGYLRLDASTAARYVPGGHAVVQARDDQIVLVPLRGPGAGGLMLKQRTAAGDRCLLVTEALHGEVPEGRRAARWDEDQGALVISRDAAG